MVAMLKPINWEQFPKGDWTAEIDRWDEADRELATLAVRVHDNLNRRLKDQEIAFIELPAIADGLSDSLWYADAGTVEEVRDLVIKALIIGTDRRFKSLVE